MVIDKIAEAHSPEETEEYLRKGWKLHDIIHVSGEIVYIVTHQKWLSREEAIAWGIIPDPDKERKEEFVIKKMPSNLKLAVAAFIMAVFSLIVNIITKF